MFLWFQSLKLYAWEESFLNKVTQIRKNEVKFLRNAFCINAIIEFTFICAPFLVSSHLSIFGSFSCIQMKRKLHVQLLNIITVNTFETHSWLTEIVLIQFTQLLLVVLWSWFYGYSCWHIILNMYIIIKSNNGVHLGFWNIVKVQSSRIRFARLGFPLENCKNV